MIFKGLDVIGINKKMFGLYAGWNLSDKVPALSGSIKS
jgi:hypothetical protein